MEREGVTKYRCHHEKRALLPIPDLSRLNYWRQQMLDRGMIGQSNVRYQGLGFGNISQRWPYPGSDRQHRDTGVDAFIISGTQTGHLSSLAASNVAVVLNAEVEQNRLWSQGESEPSSEALSHAVIYQQRHGCNAVIHVHCPLIWHQARKLSLSCTDSNTAYGTPTMAQEIRSLLTADQGVIAMLGHEDGIISYGPCLSTAAEALVRLQASAKTLHDSPAP
ncbi:class II aldolase/adducin family protein [Aestuariirhabdus sp. Z084]|uniref:class II aldolase/adducin family protein n=1 Tax=Aestuariirhabdus haliotis TaxID=2918751 RepID=UPI00201B3CB7|nr:class II aldolase/adducin family protein [Aestuariirhabdus haliotis]MCL6416468.1 class II aldolase/adducin family protein [Aestuariirhabdus haliotis]MCL6420458.1 class II aldolase/adducin family protein [Aestuariirhabdus haliotis]